MVASVNCASVRWHFDCATPDGYALSLLDKLGLQVRLAQSSAHPRCTLRC